jgi:hypothetical protein
LYAFPGKYFAIQDIVTTNHKEINMFGFLCRFGLIFIFSLFIAFFYNGDIYKLIEYSMCVSFLLIWPFILNTVIYRNKREEEGFASTETLDRKYVKNYLIVYFMYAIICVFVSLLALPVYNLIVLRPMNIYNFLLLKYLSFDQLQQAVISNIIACIIMPTIILIIKKILSSFLRKRYK